jgi:hypothetical protein
MYSLAPIVVIYSIQMENSLFLKVYHYAKLYLFILYLHLYYIYYCQVCKIYGLYGP